MNVPMPVIFGVLIFIGFILGWCFHKLINTLENF